MFFFYAHVRPSIVVFFGCVSTQVRLRSLLEKLERDAHALVIFPVEDEELRLDAAARLVLT